MLCSIEHHKVAGTEEKDEPAVHREAVNEDLLVHNTDYDGIHRIIPFGTELEAGCEGCESSEDSNSKGRCCSTLLRSLKISSDAQSSFMLDQIAGIVRVVLEHPDERQYILIDGPGGQLVGTPGS